MPRKRGACGRAPDTNNHQAEPALAGDQPGSLATVPIDRSDPMPVDVDLEVGLNAATSYLTIGGILSSALRGLSAP